MYHRFKLDSQSIKRFQTPARIIDRKTYRGSTVKGGK